MDQQQRMSQIVEREVRFLIGELNMQLIVARAALEVRAGPEEKPAPPPPPPQPEKKPDEQPPMPPPPHEPPRPHAARGNGRLEPVT